MCNDVAFGCIMHEEQLVDMEEELLISEDVQSND